MQTDFARAFRVIRAAYGWQQAEMAKNLGISASQLSLIEKGKRQPSLRVVEQLANTADVPSALVMLLASDARHDEDSQIPALADALVRLMKKASEKK